MILAQIFARPEALPLLLLAPALWFVLAGRDRARARRVARVAGPRAPSHTAELVTARRRRLRHLGTTGLLLALVALAQPSWGRELRSTEGQGVDLLICLDLSRSMLARDQRPSRLGHAQRELRRLAERAEGDRLGLVTFAGEARLAVPLTSDHESFAELVELADPLSLRRGGSDIGAALEIALDAFANASGEHEAVILISDGEDLSGRALEVARKCKERKIRVHCAGVGSALGSKIAVGGGFLRDREGGEVVTALDAPGLRRIAELTGGSFVDASSASWPLVELYESRVLPMARKSFESAEASVVRNHFQWPLLAAFLCWLVVLSCSDRRRA